MVAPSWKTPLFEIYQARFQSEIPCQLARMLKSRALKSNLSLWLWHKGNRFSG